MRSRRDFLKFSAVGISSLSLPSKLFAQESFSDYKALVVVYHAGGNDALNMFVPSGDDPKKGYPMYASIREKIRVSNSNLPLNVTDGKLDLSSGNPYNINGDLREAYLKGFYKHTGMDVATNALMPEVAHLINEGKIAVLTNAGNLIAPSTKAELKAKTKPLPPFLYAHNHQTKLVMNGEAGLLDYTGWAGRLFDAWQGVNGGDIYGMNIGIGGNEHLFYGKKTSPLIIRSSGPSSYVNIKREIYDTLMDIPMENKFQSFYQKLQTHSFSMQDTLVNDWKNAPTFNSSNAYGGELFSFPSNETLEQKSPVFADISMLRDLEAVAKLAKIGKDRGLKRQIFFVFDGGYDTHSNQTQQHARKLRGLSMGMGDFYQALEEIGMENEVTTLTVSDFGRSSGSNGDGTDHAWGGSYFVMGGAVKGGLYGTLPDLTLGSDDDMARKGRLIPTTSMSQYYATLVKWFGADDVMLSLLFPELENFTLRDLGFMK